MLLSQQFYRSHPSIPRRTHPPRAEVLLRKGYHWALQHRSNNSRAMVTVTGQCPMPIAALVLSHEVEQSKSPGSSISHQSITTPTRYASHRILQEPHCLARTLDSYVPLLRVQTTEKVQQSWKVKCIYLLDHQWPLTKERENRSTGWFFQTAV